MFTPITVPRLLSSGPPSAASPGMSALRILSWNVHKQTGPAFIAELRGLLRAHHPDLLVLQEARCDGDFTSWLEKSENPFWAASPNLSLRGQADPAGVLTACKTPPSISRPMLSRFSEPVFRTPKPMLLCEYPLSYGGPLLVLNIHSLNFSLRMTGYREQLESLLQSAGRHSGPIILAGDFNTWNRPRMEYLAAAAKDKGLSRVGFGGNENPAGWVFNRTLDHIYFSVKTLQVKPGSAQRIESARTSDHLPLFVEFLPV